MKPMYPVLRGVVSPILLLAPYILGYSVEDSTETSIRIAFGHGSYSEVTRDCSGNVLGFKEIPFTEAGAEIDHRYGNARIGIKAEYLALSEGKYTGTSYTTEASQPSKPKSGCVIVPNFGVQWKYFGADAGFVFVSPLLFALDNNKCSMMGSLRIGNRESWYFSINRFNNLPLYSGGGIVDFGFGMNMGSLHSNAWIGLSGAPYDKGAISFKCEFPVSSNILMDVRGSLGMGEVRQYGLSLGCQYFW